MKNILSYKPGSTFCGKEIKDWILYQIVNQTSHRKEANQLRKYMNINDGRMYTVCLKHKSTGCNMIDHRPLVMRAK